MDDLGTLLGIWAHPDDETYLTAGLMAQAVRDGRRVVCVTATRGEGGSMDEERWPPATMGAVRTAELLRSMEILGVTEHRFLEGPVDGVDGATHSTAAHNPATATQATSRRFHAAASSISCSSCRPSAWPRRGGAS